MSQDLLALGRGAGDEQDIFPWLKANGAVWVTRDWHRYRNREQSALAVRSRQLPPAELIRSDAPGVAAVAFLFDGEVSAYAFNREALRTLAQQRSGFRVLEDNFAVTALGIALPPAEQALLGAARQFLEEAKASGLVARAIDANGVRGVQVAAPGE